MKQYEKIIEVMRKNGGYSTLGFLSKKLMFESKVKCVSFKEIKNRINFVDYEFISRSHTKLFELASIVSF